MPEFYTWTILLINQFGEIGEKPLSVLGSKGGQICPIMHIPFFTFTGMEFLTYSNIVRVPHPRVQKLLETIMIIYQKTFISARVFLSLLGQLSAAADFVMLGRQHLRPLQMSLLSKWRPQKVSLNHQIKISANIVHHLDWWRQEEIYQHLEDKSPLTHNIYGRQPVGWNQKDYCFMESGWKPNFSYTYICWK